jgi:hypothetical protein
MTCWFLLPQKSLRLLCETWVSIAVSADITADVALTITSSCAAFPGPATIAKDYLLAKQRNCIDCGVFCLFFLDNLLFGDPTHMFEKRTTILHSNSLQVCTCIKEIAKQTSATRIKFMSALAMQECLVQPHVAVLRLKVMHNLVAFFADPDLSEVWRLNLTVE